ncbi:uncharacterized protein [Arachis hypogaea]
MEDDAREDTMDAGPKREDADHIIRLVGCTKEFDKREDVTNGSMHTDAHVVASDGDDDDDEPIAKRMRQKYDWTRTPQPRITEGEIGTASETNKAENPKGSDMRGELIAPQCAQMLIQLHPMRMTMMTSPLARDSTSKLSREKHLSVTEQTGKPSQPTCQKQQINQPRRMILNQKLRQQHWNPYILSQRDPESEKLWADVKRRYGSRRQMALRLETH